MLIRLENRPTAAAVMALIDFSLKVNTILEDITVAAKLLISLTKATLVSFYNLRELFRGETLALV